MTFEEAIAELRSWESNNFADRQWPEIIALRTVLAALEGGNWEFVWDPPLRRDGDPSRRRWVGPLHPYPADAMPVQSGEAS